MKTMTETTVQNFAAAVRAELADLPKRELEELTEGLAADLEERFAEEGDAFNPGSAAAYAAELREAAGVAPKPTKRKAFSSAALIENTQAWFRRTALGTATLDFGISIRPVWWTLRGLVAWLFIVGLGFNSASSFVLLPVFVFLSIQWGRKKWFTNRFFAAILLPLNLLAILLVVPAQDMLVHRLNSFTNAESMLQSWPATEGLRLDGQPITELKAFDANQKEVTGLSFKDQSGNIVETPATAVAYFVMPDIMGMNLSEATLALGQAGIPAVDFVYLNGADENNSVVVKVEPSTPGDLVTKFDTVIVTLDKR